MLDVFDSSEQEELDLEPLNEIPREVRKLRTQPYDKSIMDLMGMLERDEIILKPNFQRNHVWDNKRASVLIESIWLSIPIPQIFVSVEDDGRWNVIDGQQRLTSLKRYFDNEYPLRGLEILPELNGLTYSQLDSKPKRLLHGGNIRIVAIHEDSHPDIKFDVFMRINQGAIQLNAQELRNCLYRGALNESLHQMVKDNNLLKILNLSKPHNRFRDIEMTLRYLALSDAKKNNFNFYPGVMKKFINDFMRVNKDISQKHLSNLEDFFHETIDKVFTVFGENSFRKWDAKNQAFDTKVNLSIMDCQMLALESYPLSKIIEKREEILNIFKDIFCSEETSSEFFDSITSGTSSKKNLNIRINFINSVFSQVLK